MLWALPEFGQLYERVSVGGYRNGKSLQSVLRSSEEVLHIIPSRAVAQGMVPSQLLTATHTAQHFLLMVGNGLPPAFSRLGLIAFLGQVVWCLLARYTYVHCHAGVPTLAPQKADLCRAENPMLSPKLFHPRIFPVLSESKKSHLAKQNSRLERACW